MVNTAASSSKVGAFGGEVIGTTVHGPARFGAATAGGAPAGATGSSTTVNRSNLVWNSSLNPSGSWTGATTGTGSMPAGGDGPNVTRLDGSANWTVANGALVSNSTAGFGGSKYGISITGTTQTADHAGIHIDGTGTYGNYSFKEETVNLHFFMDYDVYDNAAATRCTIDVKLGTSAGGTQIFKGQLIHNAGSNQAAYPQTVTFGGVSGKQGLDATSPSAGLTLNGTTQGTYHLSFPYDTSGLSSGAKIFIQLAVDSLDNSGKILIKNIELYAPNWMTGVSGTLVSDSIYSGEAGVFGAITTSMNGDAQVLTETTHVATTWDFSYNKNTSAETTTDGFQAEFTGTSTPYYIYDGFREGRYPIHARSYIANLNDPNGTFREFSDAVDFIDIISGGLVLKAYRTKDDAIADTNEIVGYRTGQVCTSNTSTNTEGFFIFEKYYFRIESSEPSIEFYIDWDDGDDNSLEKANSEIIKLEEPSFFAVTSHVFSQHKKHHPVIRCKSIDGYFSKYYTAWEDLGTYKTTITSSPVLTAVATSVPVAERTGFSNGDYIRIEGEYLKITSGGGATGAGSFTVTRGSLDSLAVHHATGAEVFLATGANQNDFSGLETDSLSAGQNDTSLVSLDSMKIHRIPTYTPANKPPIAVLKSDKNIVKAGIDKIASEQTPFQGGSESNDYFMKAELYKYGSYSNSDIATWSGANSPAIEVTYIEKDPKRIKHELLIDGDSSPAAPFLNYETGVKRITLKDGDYITEALTTTTAELPKVPDTDGYFDANDIEYYFSHKDTSEDNYTDGGDFSGDQRTVLTVSERKDFRAQTVYMIEDSEGRKEYFETENAGSSRFDTSGYTGAGSLPINRLGGNGIPSITGKKFGGQYMGYLTAAIDNSTSTTTLALSERTGIQAYDVLLIGNGMYLAGEYVSVASSHSNATGPGNITVVRNASGDEDGSHSGRITYEDYMDRIETWNIGASVWRVCSTFESGCTVSRVVPLADVLKIELKDVRENSGVEAGKLGKNDRMALVKPSLVGSNSNVMAVPHLEHFITPIGVVSTGNPIVEKNDPERTVNFDFSESHARSPNSSIANYYFDKGTCTDAHSTTLDSLQSAPAAGDAAQVHISRIMEDSMKENQSNYPGWSVQYQLDSQPMDEHYRFLPKEYLTKLQVRDNSISNQFERFDGFEYSYLYHSDPFLYYYYDDSAASKKHARPESLRKWEIFTQGAYNNAEITDSGESQVVVFNNGTTDTFTWNSDGVAGNYDYTSAQRGGAQPNSPLRFSHTSDDDSSNDSSNNPSGEGVNERASYWFLVVRPDKFDRIFFQQSEFMVPYNAYFRGKFNTSAPINQPPTFADISSVNDAFEAAAANGVRYLKNNDSPKIRIQAFYTADQVQGVQSEGNIAGKGWKPLKYIDTTKHPENDDSSFCKSGSLTWVPPSDWTATTAAEIETDKNWDMREGMYADDTTDGPRHWINSGYGILIGLSYSSKHPMFWNWTSGSQAQGYQNTAGKNERSGNIVFNDAFCYNDSNMQLITVEDPHHVSLNDMAFSQSISFSRNGLYHTIDNVLGISTTEKTGAKSGSIRLGGVDLNNSERDTIKKYQAQGVPVYYDVTHTSGNITRFFGKVTSMKEDFPTGEGLPKYGIQLHCDKTLEINSSGVITSDGYISLGGEKGNVESY